MAHESDELLHHWHSAFVSADVNLISTSLWYSVPVVWIVDFSHSSSHIV